jgi:O-antigen ligase
MNGGARARDVSLVGEAGMDPVQTGMPGPLVRTTLYLFVFSIPFELPIRDLPLDVPRMTAAVFLAATLLEAGVCYRRVPWVLALFGAYLWIYLAAFLFNGGQYPAEVLRLFVQLAQAVLLFWAASHLLRIPRVLQATLITFAAACALRAAVQVFRVPLLATVAESQRATAFAQNANQSAMVLAAGMLVLIGLQYGRTTPWLRPRLLAWPLLALLGMALFETGSRGGMAALVMGLVVFTTATPGARHKLRALVVLVAALGSLYVAAAHSDFMQQRMQLAEAGNLAGRERIYPALVGMWLEKPAIGWGPVANKYELGERLAEPVRRRRGAHNHVLDVLTSTGLVGATVYLSGVALCFLAAWHGRRSVHGALSLALLATLLVTNLSGDWPVAPVWWLALAYGVASGVSPPARTAAGSRRVRGTVAYAA